MKNISNSAFWKHLYFNESDEEKQKVGNRYVSKVNNQNNHDNDFCCNEQPDVPVFGTSYKGWPNVFTHSSSFEHPTSWKETHSQVV